MNSTCAVYWHWKSGFYMFFTEDWYWEVGWRPRIGGWGGGAQLTELRDSFPLPVNV